MIKKTMTRPWRPRTSPDQLEANAGRRSIFRAAELGVLRQVPNPEPLALPVSRRDLARDLYFRRACVSVLILLGLLTLIALAGVWH